MTNMVNNKENPRSVRNPVVVGQVYADMDKREAGRHLEVIRIDGSYAFCVRVVMNHGFPMRTGTLASKHQVRIRLDRLGSRKFGLKYQPERLAVPGAPNDGWVPVTDPIAPVPPCICDNVAASGIPVTCMMPKEAVAVPAIDSTAFVHFLAIQAALPLWVVGQLNQRLSALSDDEVRDFLNDLAKQPIPTAVNNLRRQMGDLS